jgi:adenylate cyclase 10
VKIAISCGKVDFSLIGDERQSHYVTVGDPVWQVKALQEIIQGGQVLVSLNGWYYTQESRYQYQSMREHRCYKILGFKEQLNIIRQQYEANLNFQEMQRNLNKHMENISLSNIAIDTSMEGLALDFVSHQNEIFSCESLI